MTQRFKLRQLVAALAGLLAAGVFYLRLSSHESHDLAIYIPPAALGVAALVAFLPWLGAQLLARGLWWSNFALGVLFCVLGTRNELAIGVPMTLLCGLSLVAADPQILRRAAHDAGFRPSAYLGTLQLMMVLALADAQTLVLFAALSAENHHNRADAAQLAVVATGLLAGFVGLYRLSLWGVVCTMCAAASLAALLIAGCLSSIGNELYRPLLLGSLLQILVPLPMLVSMATKRPLPALPASSRSLAASGAVVLATLASIGFAFLKHSNYH